jgi:glycosyltransferase involved in cell wall biosynthesis
MNEVVTRFPRVLIYGETFHKNSGGGITLNSLFGNWPVDNIFILTDNISRAQETQFEHFYLLGRDEIKSPYSVLGIGNTPESRIVELSEYAKDLCSSTKKAEKGLSQNGNGFKKIKRIVRMTCEILGIYNFMISLKPSLKLINWIKATNPDVIYFQPHYISDIKFIIELHHVTGIPYCIHIMDDYYTFYSRKLDFMRYNKLLFNKLVELSSVNIAICEEMSKEYSIRYGEKFHHFQHSVDMFFWDRDYKIKPEPKPFIIQYSGRLSVGTSNSFLLLSEAIELLNRKGFMIEFRIQTMTNNSKMLSLLSKFKNNLIQKPILYDELPLRYSEADLLVLPIDFDKRSIEYIRLSMPTKAPEYMASGVPIMVFAPEETALFKYAKSQAWAFCTSEHTIDSLCSLLIEIINNPEKRKQVASTAREVVIRNHNKSDIQRDFMKLLNSVKSE